MPTSLVGTDGEAIQIVVPPDPMPAAYHELRDQVIALVDNHAPDLVVHLGLDVGSDRGVFRIERSASREGYHQFPDIRRKVFTRTENKEEFGKAPLTLASTLDLDAAEKIWRQSCASITLATTANSQHGAKNRTWPEKQNVLVKLSDDVGTYVCGFCYYVALLHLQSQTGTRHTIFLHVPPLESNADILVGVRIVQEVVRALVHVLLNP